MVGGSGGTLILFAYDGSRVAFELEGATASAAPLTRSYAYNSYIDSPLLMIDEDGSSDNGAAPAGTKFYYLQDRRFSAVALTYDGDVLERYRYQAFGKWTVHQAPDGWLSATNNQSRYQNPYGFTGRRYDAETATATSGGGLWHYRNRMYSASLGRFLQRDPAGYIDGFNLYAYVRNNPLRFVDAFGLFKQSTRSSSFNSGATTNLGSGITPLIAGRLYPSLSTGRALG